MKSSREPVDVLIQRARKLESELHMWRQSLPTDLQPGVPFRSTIASSPSPHQALYLHYAYHGSLIAIHSIFAYPWYSPTLASSKGESFHRQVADSTKALVEASRQIVLAVKYVDVRKPWPAW